MNVIRKTPLAIPTEPDERITAWEAIAAHPAFRQCYKDGRLLDAMLATLDGIVVEPETAPTVDPDDLRPGDRFRVIYEYRVDHLGDWQPVAPSRYELLSRDGDPRVAVVREWLSVVPLDSDAGDEGLARDLLASIDAARAEQ